MHSKPFIFSIAKIAALAAISSLIACGTDSEPLPTLNFDRPTDMAFACYGDLRVSGSVTGSAQPLSSCQGHEDDNVPVGQEGVVAPSFYGFVLQPSRGTMAVVHVPSLGVVDNDPLTPGLNDIPVGSLPVGIVGDSSGCFMVTANSGSCDLSSVDVSSVINRSSSAVVTRSSLTSPAGDRLLVKPRSIATGTQIAEIGNACPERPTGKVYVSYPDCKMVAAVDPGTGEVQSALVFRDDGTVEIAGPADFEACPKQCGDTVSVSALGGPDAGVAEQSFDERPVHMEVSPDGTTLYIAGEASPFFTIVDLDSEGLPTANVTRIRVEGDVGILKFAVTDRIEMGGDELSSPQIAPVGEFQFAYLITTDSTIRVVDLDNQQECDTQVDPRYLAAEKDVSFLSCMPVGDIRTPPRRAYARSPGIHLPGRFSLGRVGLQSLALPLDISFSTIASAETNSDVSPSNMAGTFAFISTASGFVFIVNIDDNNYADFENDSEPTLVSMPLALAHQLRDNVTLRHLVALENNCSTPVEAASVVTVGTRQITAPAQLVRPEEIATSKIHELPFLRGQICNGLDEEDSAFQTVVSEFSFVADIQTREQVFPDVRSAENQQWSLLWEGALSGDGLTVAIDGPLIRKGIVGRQGDTLVLSDASAPFCNMGVEDFDIASLVGCDPLLGDALCGVNETCFVHPDTTGSTSSGVCVNSDNEAILSGVCRDFYISRRRYSVVNSAATELELAERRRILRTSPLDGCESDTQCLDFATQEPLLALNVHPLGAELPVPEREFSWVCEADPSRVAGVDRCVMSCESTSDCEDAFFCSSGRCVEAPLPPAECVASIQRYQLRVGEAFAVLGSDDGFLHSVVVDELTGQCISDPNLNVLKVGRLPLRPAACDDDDDFSTGPNPCSTVVAHVEEYTPYVVNNGVCEAQEDAFRTLDVPAVRFSNPSMSFHLVNPETKGDLECVEDRAGTGPTFGTVYEGYQIVIEIGGGFSPKIVNLLQQPNPQPALPTTMVTGPSGNIWVLDQGDINSFTNGRIFRFDPRAAGLDFEVNIIF